MSTQETLTRSVFHRLSSLLWGLAVGGVVLLALYVSLGRILAANLQAFQADVLAAVNERVPFRVEATALRGEWHAFTPELVFTDLHVSLPGGQRDPLELSSGRVGLDVLGSLLSRSLQFTSLQLDALDLRGELTADGRLVFPGLQGTDTDASRWLREFLLNIEHVTLNGNLLQLTLPDGDQRQFSLDLQLAREGSIREVQAQLGSTRGVAIAVAGRGVGNPFQPEAFTGDLYLEVGATDLDAARALLAAEPPVQVEGELQSRWWLGWNRGELAVETQLQFESLQLRAPGGDWVLPLDELSLSASLLERRNRWTVFAADVEARRGDARAIIPRLQLDAWGESLRLRTREVDLAAVNALVTALELMPEALQSVFTTLNARGSLDSLQLAIPDLAAPVAAWELEANFDRLAVDSWRGAPGVENAHGYVELSQRGGRVVLDSQNFSMAFPTVYSQPLDYDDFYGTIFLSWDDTLLELDSSLVTATGVEGTARALFGLTIPLQASATGLEMDLAVGLQNSHPKHRVKYIPRVLNENLRNWLSGAIGDGDVREGAFIWRGSLRGDAAELRTVQLFFNVANTALQYHPQWPAVDRVDGVVLIDDTNVSVWADSARMYDAALQRLSVEAWMGPSQQMMLAVDGRLSGSAADGLRIVNESLLGDLTAGAFAGWTAEGDLDAQLRLRLNLADMTQPPDVQVATTFSGVDLGIEPGGLDITSVGGRLDFSSAAGFSSTDLAGLLWQQPLRLQLNRLPAEPGAAMAGSGVNAVEVRFGTRVAVDDLRAWLDQPALALAAGTSAIDGRVLVRPGQAPTLVVGTDLVGTALDLPSPWAKPAEAVGELQLQLPLGANAGPLTLQLGDALQVALATADGGASAVSLGINQAPPELAEGLVRVAGQASLVVVDEWLQFVERYFTAPAPTEAGSAAQPTRPLEVRVDDLQAARLHLWDRALENVRLSFALDDAGWRVRGSTDWLRGSYLQPVDAEAALNLDYLDIAGLAAVRPVDAEALLDPATAGEALTLPPIQVVVTELARGPTALGRLRLDLASDGAIIRATNIQGELAGLRLPAEQPARLDWEQGLETRLEATLAFDDFGDTLARFDFPRFLQTQGGQLQLAVAWPQSPADFELANTQGSLEIDVERGTFLETPTGATGALKILSILNLAEIVQQLSLTHMFESGVPFRQMGGEVNFLSGTIDVPDLAIVGSSSSFNFSGTSRIADHSLDGELVATLPVASNLPWVAALAGGLPVAAGVYVVSKVFEKQVNRLSSGVYAIGGTWEEPTVEFDRIFDDAARAGNADSPALGPVNAGTPLPLQSTDADSAEAEPGEAPAPTQAAPSS